MNTNVESDHDVENIKKLGEEFFAGTNAGDLARRMATMAPGTIIMPPGRPTIVGKEEIQRLSQNFQMQYEEKCTLVYDEIERAGDWGFVRATVSVTRTPKSGGKIEKESIKNLWVVKRQADGAWKFWRIMFNSNPAPLEG